MHEPQELELWRHLRSEPDRLRADAVGRSSGTLRDDLVLLAVRPAPVE